MTHLPLRKTLTTATLLAALALPAAISPATATAPDPATVTISSSVSSTQQVSQATLNWSIRDSFISYIKSPLAAGTINATGGITFNETTKKFAFTGGTGTLTNGSGTITYPGSIAFTGHKGELDIKFSNIRVKLAGDKAAIILDATSKGYNGSPDVNAKNVEFATFKVSTSQANQKLSGTATSGQLTEAGAAAFVGFYPAGNRGLSDFTLAGNLAQSGYVFTDVPTSHVFYKEVSWLAQRGITTGWVEANGTRTFRPTEDVGRYAMAAFLYRLQAPKDYTAPATSPFKDVPTSHTFYKEIAWMYEAGITRGWLEADGTRTFRPDTSVNRDMMAAFFYRMAGSPAYEAPLVSPFKDVKSGDVFYKEISWLASQGITTGWVEADGTRSYRPVTPVKRDVMAAFIYRYAN